MRAYIILAVSLLVSINADARSLAMNELKLPPGFSIELYATGVKDARELALGDKGVVYVGSTDAGKIYAQILLTMKHLKMSSLF